MCVSHMSVRKTHEVKRSRQVQLSECVICSKGYWRTLVNLIQWKTNKYDTSYLYDQCSNREWYLLILYLKQTYRLMMTGSCGNLCKSISRRLIQKEEQPDIGRHWVFNKFTYRYVGLPQLYLSLYHEFIFYVWLGVNCKCLFVLYSFNSGFFVTVFNC